MSLYPTPGQEPWYEDLKTYTEKLPISSTPFQENLGNALADPESVPGALLAAAIDTAVPPLVADVVTPLVAGEVADAVDGHVPGSRLAFVEYGSGSGISTSDTTSGLGVSALLATVTGAGRPVLVRWWIPDGAYHSVADTKTILAIAYQKSGVYQGYLPMITQSSSPYTDRGTGPQTLEYSMTLDDGVDYSFYPVIKPSAAGTSTITTNGTVRSTMMVVSQ